MKSLNELSKVKKFVIGVLLQIENKGLDATRDDIYDGVIFSGVTKSKSNIARAIAELYRAGILNGSWGTKYIQITDTYYNKILSELK